MRTVILGNRPPAVEALLEERRRQGLDLHDEMWNGEYHMAPAAHPRHGFVQFRLLRELDAIAQARGLIVTTEINIGTDYKDYRVPDGAVLRALPDRLYVPTAVVVVEVLSPHDETFEKFAFYNARHIPEIVVADPEERTIEVYRWVDGEPWYAKTTTSAQLDVSARELTETLPWP